MIPLIVLVVALLAVRGLGAAGVKSLDSWAAATRWGLAVMFLFTSLAHFKSMRHDLVKMVPPWVPDPELVILLTGVCEVAGAIGLLIPRTRMAAAIALIVFLIAIFPANAHAAQSGVQLGGKPATPLVPRALMQLLFIGLTGWSGVLARRE
jgi:uncharacterized membrane protein